MDAIFFWLFSIGMIVCGLAVVLNRNPVASALCFAFTIVFMSALFVMLSAFFLAAVQILITAGAVMVLFLFIIMLLDVTSAERMPRQKVWMACTLLLGLGFLYLVARTLDATPIGTRTAHSLPPIPATITLHHLSLNPLGKRQPLIVKTETLPNDDTHQIGRLLFTRYLAPFEVTSLLILVATIGVIVLCKEETPKIAPPKESETAPETPRKNRSALTS